MTKSKSTTQRTRRQHGGRRGILVAVVAALLASSAFAAECPAAKQPKTQQALIDLERDWAKALERKDAAVVACILAPEFVDSTPDGELRNREQTLAAIAQRKDNSNELQDLSVTMLGEAAVVHGVNHVRDSSGKEVAVVRFTDVFAYRGGQWKAVSGHETLVAQH
jgi:ketosteroid isomerase-like protein